MDRKKHVPSCFLSMGSTHYVPLTSGKVHVFVCKGFQLYSAAFLLLLLSSPPLLRAWKNIHSLFIICIIAYIVYAYLTIVEECTFVHLFVCSSFLSCAIVCVAVRTCLLYLSFLMWDIIWNYEYDNCWDHNYIRWLRWLVLDAADCAVRMAR